MSPLDFPDKHKNLLSLVGGHASEQAADVQLHTFDCEGTSVPCVWRGQDVLDKIWKHGA